MKLPRESINGHLYIKENDRNNYLRVQVTYVQNPVPADSFRTLRMKDNPSKFIVSNMYTTNKKKKRVGKGYISYTIITLLIYVQCSYCYFR